MARTNQTSDYLSNGDDGFQLVYGSDAKAAFAPRVLYRVVSSGVGERGWGVLFEYLCDGGMGPGANHETPTSLSCDYSSVEGVDAAPLGMCCPQPHLALGEGSRAIPF